MALFSVRVVLVRTQTHTWTTTAVEKEAVQVLAEHDEPDPQTLRHENLIRKVFIKEIKPKKR